MGRALTWPGGQIKGHPDSPAPSDCIQRKGFVCPVGSKAKGNETEPVAGMDWFAQLRLQHLNVVMNLGSQSGTALTGSDQIIRSQGGRACKYQPRSKRPQQCSNCSALIGPLHWLPKMQPELSGTKLSHNQDE